MPQIEYDRFEGDHRKRRSEKLGKGIVEGVRRRSRNSEEVDQNQFSPRFGVRFLPGYVHGRG